MTRQSVSMVASGNGSYGKVFSSKLDCGGEQ